MSECEHYVFGDAEALGGCPYCNSRDAVKLRAENAALRTQIEDALRTQIEELRRELAEWESEDAPVQAYERLAHQRYVEAKAATERAERAEKQVEELKQERTHRIEEAQKVGVAYREWADRAEKQLAEEFEKRARAEDNEKRQREYAKLAGDRLAEERARLAKVVAALEWIAQEYADEGSGITAQRALAAARAEAPEKVRPDEDRHCTRCGLEWKDMTEVPHECPPGFAARAEAPGDPSAMARFIKDVCK